MSRPLDTTVPNWAEIASTFNRTSLASYVLASTEVGDRGKRAVLEHPQRSYFSLPTPYFLTSYSLLPYFLLPTSLLPASYFFTTYTLLPTNRGERPRQVGHARAPLPAPALHALLPPSLARRGACTEAARASNRA